MWWKPSQINSQTKSYEKCLVRIIFYFIKKFTYWVKKLSKATWNSKTSIFDSINDFFFVKWIFEEHVPRPLDIEYFKYSILSNRVFNTVFNTFFRNVNIDIGYSILFGAGIDIEYSLL